MLWRLPPLCTLCDLSSVQCWNLGPATQWLELLQPNLLKDQHSNSLYLPICGLNPSPKSGEFPLAGNSYVRSHNGLVFSWHRWHELTKVDNSLVKRHCTKYRWKLGETGFQGCSSTWACSFEGLQVAASLELNLIGHSAWAMSIVSSVISHPTHPGDSLYRQLLRCCRQPNLKQPKIT